MSAGTLNSFGDSITCGPGAYPIIVAAQLQLQLRNLAAPGNQAPDQAGPIYATEVGPGALSTYMIGVNDVTRGHAPVDLAMFHSCLMAEAAYLAIPKSSIVFARDPRFRFEGPWRPSPVYGLGMNTATAGASFEVILEGDTLYLAYIQLLGAMPADVRPGVCSLSVDGRPVADFHTASGVPATTFNGNCGAPGLIRIGGLAKGTHTLRGQVSGLVFVDWAWGNANVSATDDPIVYLGTPTPCSLAGYAQVGGTPEATQAHRDAAISVAAQLTADGLNVVSVDSFLAIDTTWDLDPDGVHPNRSGQANLAQAFLARMQS